jgi:hypothetical protein
MTTPKEPKTLSPRAGRFPWLVATSALWLLAPFVLIVLLSVVAQQQSVNGADVPTWLPAEDAGPSSERQVELSMTWGEAPTVFAPAWAGTVREVLVAVGSTVKSGDPIVRVDGILRVAWHSPAPFYRSLALGDQGDDVAALNALLKSRSFSAGDGANFTRATKRGVGALAAQLGAGSGIVVFDPSMILYLPAEELRIATVELAVGALASPPGAVVLEGQPVLDRGVLVEAGSGEKEVPTLLAAGPGEKLTIGETVVELVDGSNAAEASLLTLSAELSAGQERVAGVLRRELPEGSFQIPAAAVHTDSDGVTCVAVLTGELQSRVVVLVIGGLAGQSVVTGDVEVGNLIGVGALEATARCSS